MLTAILIAWLLLPQFNHVTGKQIALSFEPKTMCAFAGIALCTGLLAGSYPALYLSKFRPLNILKGRINTSLAEIVSRKGLVIFQFALSATMIVGVIIIYQQIKFIQSTDPGYNKDNIVKFDSEGALQGNEDDFIAQLKKIPGVVNASFTFNNMVGRNYGNYGLSWDGKDPNADTYFEGFGAGYNFIETMGMHMTAGRSFSNAYGDEYSKIILNEAAISVMHLKDPVGKTVTLNNQPKQVIGVLKDFHFESLHEAVKPAYFTLQQNPGKNPWFKIMVRIRASDQKRTMASIQHLYETYNPGFPFTFSFLSEAYQRQYDTETRVSLLSKYFAGLAVIISCLGLFGLAAFTARQRQKEIGIRKVVGATAGDITMMLSKDFIKLILVALLISFPVSWWLMNNWLQGFAYRVSIDLIVFVIAGISVAGIALLTISFQSVKAALANPGHALRTE
jgi:ABC-type antimicrobial peptide transport system permease subunit